MTLFADDHPRDILPFDGTARYIPSFIDALEADRHLLGIVEETPWEQRPIILFGREVLQPRLACWYGDHAYSYSGIRLEPRAWTDRLRKLRDRCSVESAVEFNSCLVNLYRDGRDSMGWHADDERELGSEPVIASVSLGDTRVFRMRHKESKTVVEIPLEHGSLLVMGGLMQKCWVHEIPKTKKHVGQRINLTFRTIITDGDQRSSHPLAVG
jgi:alkylated DNA repair dioxygenase AlkB